VLKTGTTLKQLRIRFPSACLKDRSDNSLLVDDDDILTERKVYDLELPQPTQPAQEMEMKEILLGVKRALEAVIE